MTLSLCTNCKGRLWQFKQTLPDTVKTLNGKVDLVLLDYQSDDGLKDWIFSNYLELLEDGRLKYFRLSNDYNYSCAYAKNVTHRLATGDVLFNLDADNTISEAEVNVLLDLPDKSIYFPIVRKRGSGAEGRLGYHRSTFYELNGYNENIIGMGSDDGDLYLRMRLKGMQPIESKFISDPILNTPEDKQYYVNVKGLTQPPSNWPVSFGVAKLLDRFGNEIILN